MTDAFKLSLENGSNILGYIFNGKRIDIGTWDYLLEEKLFYSDLDDKKLKGIIDNRNIMMNRISDNTNNS